MVSKKALSERDTINRTVEAIARGEKRLLLVMATGTGKTYTAFQIIYRLWKSKIKKRILYLADRNNLITQTKKGDFKHFKDKCHIIKQKKIDTSYEIYLALYQGLTNYDDEADAYKNFSPNFFDLIIVDECHRGSVDADKAWHKILQYFSSATQIGMTATPKETKNLSNIEYFGEPIYTYSLKQGIDDGFLAPYKVLRVGMNVDLEITGKSDTYIVRITGDDPVAKGYLEDFINPEAPFPVIASTSKLMSTGTDTQTCKLICLDANIGSMTEFKQIIGRGTRINEDYGKLYFTIIDFRNVTDKFADKDFDGAPVKIKETQQDDTLSETCIDEGSGDEQIDPATGDAVVFDDGYEADDADGATVAEPESPYGPKPKVYINGVDVSILSERKQYLDANGQLITTSVKEYCKTGIVQSYRSLDHFLQTWNSADKKKAIIEELEAQGIIFEELKEEIKSDLDVFDLICHIAWDAPALTRKERVENVRKRNYWAKYGENARRVLNALLDKYAETGIENIEEMQVLTIEPLKNLGTPAEIVKIFGGKEKYLAALKELENEIYAA